MREAFIFLQKTLDNNYDNRNCCSSMITGFRSKDAEKIFNGVYSRKIPFDVQRRAQIKLALLDAASCLEVMKVPPSNRLEKLKGNRGGEWSIKINGQWRITFKYDSEKKNFYDVSVEDYH